MPGFKSQSQLLRGVLLLLLAGAPLTLADTASEAKLREGLRNTMLQLRTAQNERAALQASQAENESKLKKLTAELESLRKQSASSEKTIADQETQLVKYKEALQSWEIAYKQATDVASAKEAARVKLADDVIILQRHLAEQRTRNTALFRTANEILTRYERFSLGEALAAKEPFVGLTRVKLENLVQDYEDKIADERIKDSDGAKADPLHGPKQSSPSQRDSVAQKRKPEGG